MTGSTRTASRGGKAGFDAAARPLPEARPFEVTAPESEAVMDTPTAAPPGHDFAQLRAEPREGATQVAQAKPAPNRTGLPDRLKSGLERQSGLDLGDVRVHYDSPKPAAVQALAYTQGSNIYVGPGQKQHLPHEGWHAVQQAQGRVRPTGSVHGTAINDSRSLEREADVMGARASRS